MTNFWNPFDPNTGASGIKDVALPGVQSGYASPAATVAAGSTTTIAYPIGRQGGAKPPDLGWVILINASPFALGCAQQRYIATIPPWTVDKFQVIGQGGFTISPVLPPNYLLSGLQVAGPTGAYATWYEGDPGGSYPQGIGPGFAETSQMIVQATLGPLAGGPLTFNVQTEPWMQSIAIRLVQTGGTATGFRASVFDQMMGVSDPGMGQTLFNNGQWAYFPINGMLPQVVVENVLNSVAGGTVSGQFMVHGLAGPLFMPQNGQMTFIQGWQGGYTRMGQTTSIGCAAAATTPFLPEPVTGTVYRLRHVTIQFAAAPAAANTVIFRGTGSGADYARFTSGTAIADIVPPSGPLGGILLADATGRIDPAEGINVINNTNQTANVSLTYDILPFQVAMLGG